MEWTKEEVGKELSEYFSKGKDDEEKEVTNLEILNTLLFDEEGGDNTGTVTVDELEYKIIQNEDEAVRIATMQVRGDLEEDPQLFNQDWLSNFLYIGEGDKRIIVSEEEDFIREMVTEDIESMGFENDSEKEIYIEKEVEKRVKEYERGLEDPINYFVDDQGIYSIEDLMKQSWININIEEASEEAIQVDGWPHFLSHYDGEYEETDNGLIVFREGF